MKVAFNKPQCHCSSSLLVSKVAVLQFSVFRGVRLHFFRM